MAKRLPGGPSSKRTSKRKTTDEERQRYFDHLNLIRKFMGITDGEGTLQFANEAPFKGLGYSEEEILRKPFWEASWFAQSSESQDMVRDSVLKALDGEVVRCEVQTFTKDGTALPVTFNISPLRGKGGNILNIVAEAESVVLDEGPGTIRGSDERHESVFGLVGEAYFEADTRDALVTVSPAGAKLLGYKSTDELVGKRLAQFWASSEKRKKFMTELSKKGKIRRREATFLRKDGIEVIVELDVHLLHDDNGKVRGTEGIFHDITWRKKAEERYKKFEAELESVAELVRDVYFRISDEWTFAFVSTAGAQFMGYGSPGELVGKPMAERWAHPEEIAQFLELLMKEGRVHGFSATLKAKNGEHLAGELDVCLLHDDGGEVIGCHGVYRDGRANRKYGGAEQGARATKVGRKVQEEQGFSQLAKGVSGGILLVQDGEIKFASGVMENLLGYDAGELIGVQLGTMVSPDLVEGVIDRYERRMAGEVIEEIEEAELIRKDGETVMVEMSGATVEHDGRSAVLSIVRDVRDRRWREMEAEIDAELMEKLEIYAPIVENSSEGVAVLTGDFSPVFVNEKLYQMFGYTPQQAEEIYERDGTLKTFLMSELFSCMSPEAANDVLETYQRRLAGEDVRLLTELQVVRGDGSIIDGELSSSRIEYKGEVADLILIRDITERKRSEAARLEAEKRYRAIFDNQLHMVYIHDELGRFIDANDFALERLGYTREDVGNISIADLVHPDDLPMSIQYVADVREKGHMENQIEIRLITNSGEVFWVEVLGVIIEQGDDHFVGMGIARDISERKWADEEIRASEEKLKDLVNKLKLSQEELATPVIQVWDRILALPLIGVVDTHRSRSIMDILLTAIVETQSKFVIVDVTGVASMDTEVTNNLIRTIQSTRLLGAECVITGIKPEVAQTMVHLGVDLSKLVIKSDMQDGLRWSLGKIGYGVKNG